MRCVNIDWLECYCHEDSIGFPHDAEFFRSLGYEVREREYGTPVYHEMFTLLDQDGHPFIEVRRRPKSDTRQLHGVLNPYSCHIRLSNRACYFSTAVANLRQFLRTAGMQFQRISRLDICYDFSLFDYGDEPNRFLQRYMSGKYSKINQANLSAHGLDQWDGRLWNSVSWGSPKSMVSTKFYNKTMELKQVKDKPYIRQAWQLAGLVDDAYALTKTTADGKVTVPEVWRVEFSLKSSVRNWFVIEDNKGKKRKLRSIRHNLDMYDSAAKLWDVFASLSEHYFHFKHYETDKRKDRCKDKLLFNLSDVQTFYHLEKVNTDEPRSRPVDMLYMRLLNYRDNCHRPNVYRACNVILEQLERDGRIREIVGEITNDEARLLQILIQKRLADKSHTLSEDIETAKAFVELEKTLWDMAPTGCEKQAEQ